MRYLTQGFLDNDDYVIMIDALGQRYNKRPSELLCIDNKIIALDFDFTVMYKSNMLNKNNEENTSGNETTKLESQIRNVQNMQRKAAM